MRFLLLGSLLLLIAVSGKDAVASAPIRSRLELERYLQITPLGKSPLDALSSAAKRRFLEGLKFRNGIITSIPTWDIENELTRAQATRILELFGKDNHVASLPDNPHPVHAPASESRIEQRFDTFSRLSETPSGNSSSNAEVRMKLADFYDRQFAPLQRPHLLAGIGSYDLTLLFHAADVLASMTDGARYVGDMGRDLDAMKQHGLATPARITELHDVLVANRRFDDANALAAAFPSAGITSLPPLRTAPGIRQGIPTALLVSTDGDSILRDPIDIDVPLRIVVIAGCHFSEDAVRAIRNDAQLGTLFHRHAIWLADENESLGDVLQWNRTYPDQPMNVAWRNADWPMLDSWAIPTFYVFRDGKLVDQWSGWSGLGEIRRHIVKDGLIQTPAGN